MIKDNTEAKIFLYIVIFIFFLLLARLFQLQIIEAGRYSKLAEKNASRINRVYAPRGIIYDRYGKPIVSNKASFTAYLDITKLKNKSINVYKLSNILQIPESKINEILKSKTLKNFDMPKIKEGLILEEVTQIEEQSYNFPGVVIRAKPVRNYAYNKSASHLIGYIGEISKDDLDRLEKKGYKVGDLLGKMGIEKAYDTYLRGIDGEEGVEVDAFGRPGRNTEVQEPVPGNDVKLTLDIELQNAAENALGDKRGAVVVLNPNNGEVLAMASHPTFDPDMFAGPLEHGKWNSLDMSGKPFLNRAISAFDGGSIFKVVVLTSVLEQHVFSPDAVFHCPGFFQFGRRIARCWKAAGHGTLTLMEGLVWSCDVVFYQVGIKEGVDTMCDYARQFGLGQKTGIDIPQESGGNVPSDEWLEKVYKRKWFPGDALNLAIGQGYLQVTPLQMANVYAQIANGKKRYIPYVVKEITSRHGDVLYFRDPKPVADVNISPENLALIRKALFDVVDRATGRRAKIEGFHASGKTGTAENPHGGAHAWFLCYAPSDNPEIVIAAFVEHGLHGDQSAAGIARDVLTWYRDNRYLKANPNIPNPIPQLPKSQ